MSASKIRLSIAITFPLQTSYCSFSGHLASVEIVDSVAVGIEDAEARRLVVILVSIPEDVHLSEGLAGDGTPVSLSVLDGSDLYYCQLPFDVKSI